MFAVDGFWSWQLMRYYNWATLLDPRISYDSLREDYADDDVLLSHLEYSKLDSQTHHDIHYAPRAAILSSPTPPAPDGGSPQKFNSTNRYTKRGGGTSTSDELAEYFRITSVPEPFDRVDPLQWRYSRRRQFPHLYRLVHNIVRIPVLRNGWNIWS
ncbi:hypothetical protein K438DRAFT_1981638 [Mycena galopus ATCC 62051]|nr:hypothetical protein K438DRAFT_1981638 [Mycena galopus ATCC 62051]